MEDGVAARLDGGAASYLPLPVAQHGAGDPELRGSVAHVGRVRVEVSPRSRARFVRQIPRARQRDLDLPHSHGFDAPETVVRSALNHEAFWNAMTDDPKVLVPVVAAIVGGLGFLAGRADRWRQARREDAFDVQAVLKERLQLRDDRIKALEEQGPDVLLERARTRVERMQEELEQETKLRSRSEQEVRATSAELGRLREDAERLQTTVDVVSQELDSLRSTHETTAAAGARLHAALESKGKELEQLKAELEKSLAVLAAAAARDARWLHMVRTQLMPPQPGRVPFHNDAEIAIRGFHVGQTQRPPVLTKVTWSNLPEVENGLHRGYRAALVFEGNNFRPGVTFAIRTPRHAESDPVHWREPSVYFGSYLEVSSGGDDLEGPLSWRECRFAVMNPDGRESAWVEFEYPYDSGALDAELDRCELQGRELYAKGEYGAADEPLRRAKVFSSRLLGDDDARTVALGKLRDEAADRAALARLRFRTGDHVRINAGDHSGKIGKIVWVGLRHGVPYEVHLDSASEPVFVRDEDVESAQV